MKNVKSLIKKFNTTYKDRSESLNQKFLADMELPLVEKKQYAFNHFKRTYKTPAHNMYYIMPFEQLRGDINHYMSLNKEETFESLLIEYINEKKPDLKFMEDFGLYKSEYDFGQFLNEYERENFPKEKKDSEIPDAIENKTIATTSQQVLAVHFLFKAFGVKGTDKTEEARFIQFLTGKEAGNDKIKNTTIYKKVCSPYKHNDLELKKDLKSIKPYFEKLGLVAVVDMINKEL